MADEHVQQDPITALADATAHRKTITIPLTDNMMEAAELLRQVLPKSQYNALWEAIVHIESMDLTDADYGIVDADPPVDSAKTREVNT